MENTVPAIFTPVPAAADIDIQALIAELKMAKAKAEQLEKEKQLLNKENQEFKEKETLEKEEKALQQKIAVTPKFYSTRNTLVLRRTPDHEKIAPARDVFAYLEIFEEKFLLKEPSTRVSEKEIEAFHEIKREGVQPTLAMIKVKVKPSPGSASKTEEAKVGEVPTVEGNQE